MKKVAVIMGSDSDLPVVGGAFKMLKSLNIPFEAHVMSAHRTPGAAAEFSENAAANGFGVIIAAAGMAAHLAGVLAAHTVLPVIAIPVKSAALGGIDALLSSVMMPPGVPIACVGIDAAKNAAVLAAQILALSDGELAARLAESKKKMADEVAFKDAALGDKIAEL